LVDAESEKRGRLVCFGSQGSTSWIEARWPGDGIELIWMLDSKALEARVKRFGFGKMR